MCCDRLSLVYFPPFFLLSPLNDDCVSFSFALDQYPLSSFSPSSPAQSVNTEFGGKKKKSCSRATVASAMLHMLPVCRCVCAFLRHSQVCVCVIPRGYVYVSSAGRKHIHLPNTNSEKGKGLRCVRQETAED